MKSQTLSNKTERPPADLGEQVIAQSRHFNRRRPTELRETHHKLGEPTIANLQQVTVDHRLKTHRNVAARQTGKTNHIRPADIIGSRLASPTLGHECSEQPALHNCDLRFIDETSRSELNRNRSLKHLIEDIRGENSQQTLVKDCAESGPHFLPQRRPFGNNQSSKSNAPNRLRTCGTDSGGAPTNVQVALI